MMLGIVFLGMPLVIYLALVCVPPGRVWRVICVLVLALLAYLWLGYLLAWAPFWTGGPRADAYMLAAVYLYMIAAVAGFVTAILGRRWAARSKLLNYPAVATLVLVLIFAPLFIMLGV